MDGEKESEDFIHRIERKVSDLYEPAKGGLSKAM